ncbi:uncharacterized protein LOC108990430 isoform X3 [Juglans regia]|uniref:Uncharacterized protein LOC108990430 isoform X3 n=1 Tax=Juglans regia TaxID=51240 RepID=A0A2I4EKM7_JUGRE|nr:uncharacterized protein LOC108990430 isoform X3 [Juglans regia]
MEDNSNKEQIVDVRSFVEAVSAEDNDAPLYQVESLCMRCGENLLSLEEPWTLILGDALANSFVAPVTDDVKDDEQMTYA